MSGMINILEIQKRLEKEKSIKSQIYLFQRNIFHSLEERNYKKARENIGNYKTLIYLPSNNDLPEIYQIRESSENLITIFEDYISLQGVLPEENFKNINNNNILIELNLLYSRIIDNIEKQNFDSARRNITSLRTLLNLESNSDYPEIISRKSDYLKTAAVMEEYIALKNEVENYKEIYQPDQYKKSEIIYNSENNNAGNIYQDFSGEIFLYGKIASLQDKSLTIEAFFNLLINPGDSFLIKKEDREIAYGEITSSTSSTARGKIKNIKNSDNPLEVNNLVYIIRK